MKVIGIIGSPHADGNGATLVREALAGAKAAGAAVEEVFLPEHRIEFCRNCDACLKTGRCAVADDFGALRGRLLGADGIVVSSPTYAKAPCARVKNLLDRFGQFAWMASSFGGKYLAAIATGSSFGAPAVAKQLTGALASGVFRRAYVSGTLGVHLRGANVSAMPKALKRARALGAKVAADIAAGKRYPLQNLAGRLPNALLMRPMLAKAIVAHRDRMRGVYDELVRTGALAPTGA